MTDQEEAFEGLKEELLLLFRRGVDKVLSDEAFNELALRVFRFQCRAVRSYGAFVRRRGLAPAAVAGWEEIPHLPTRAFKSVALVSGQPSRAEAVFLTSGTSQGKEGRGRHFIRSLELYRASLLPNFRASVLPDGGRPPVLALLPDPAEAPESSLSFMVGDVKERWCQGRGGFFADPMGEVRVRAFFEALREAEEGGEPVLLVGTAFSFVRWLEAAGRQSWRVHLPAGSRIMETGGFKGRSVTLSREELYRALEASLGVPAARIVNEYGMTEMLSQFYEPVWGIRGSRLEGESRRMGGRVGGDPDTAGGRGDDLSERYHRGPPWVRTRVVDPLTLQPRPEGEVGILAHLDLANLGSVSAILTEDLGRSVPGGFRLQGRSPGAEPRGCSLAMEDFLEGMEGGGDVL
ncbi:MAG: hypothetical protein ACWGSQ_00850 [Longimicrobiales bacterium]